MVKIRLFDTVMLAHDLPHLGLVGGEMGAVVEIYGDNEAVEGEFIGPQGSTYGLHTLNPNDLLVPHSKGMRWRGQGLAA